MRSAVLACLILVACGDEMRVEDYDAAYAESWCRYQLRCGAVPDFASCIAQNRYPDDPDLIAAVHAGTVGWHPDVAERCVAALDDLTCDRTDRDYRYLFVPCFGAFTGTLHEGDACSFGTECVSYECWNENINCLEACCRGTCQGDEPAAVAAHIGDRCRYTVCAEGYCEDSLCVPLKAEGTECEQDHECETGLACVYGGPTAICRRLPKSGEDCGSGEPLSCAMIGDACHEDTWRCGPVQFAGESCAVSLACASGLECDATDHCVAPSLGKLGESCGSRACDAGLACSQGLLGGTCIEPKADGEPCFWDVECVSFRCDGTGVCSSDACI